ncbi:amidase signature enzyme [Dichomitus squalens LYAD-421 SS1]|uniref:amidase n=2 Tax=Dichomitus squalens TaxID=114155 RepID=A0A4Q9MAA5_9APHY|nr:amidase signature enzyme [Dichomitus squalens LYAD-421 SS1]EJF58979.1 amidase signature enzyme [Dichomitus squalens LYAD-421 SS1]TBU24114.1 amidase signature enzyme [Dichomitus squalens]TBU56422.1 amidase signature enzyme [Dichomitus squalens]
MLSFLGHRRACVAKQREREERIRSLPPEYHAPLSLDEERILSRPASEVIASVQAGTLLPTQVLLAYSKKALRAHAATNCLTEVLIAKAEGWAKTCNTEGPLAGMPVSLKDTVGFEGEDSCIGYSAWVGKPMQKDAAIVRLLKDAGAVPFVKTNIPITLLSFESANDVFGTTTNPHNKDYSPGGSTGGEAALLAYGGSRLGIGTDVAGSVRAPAHFSGVYSIKASMHRFLKTGNATSMPGQEGIPAVYSPMTRTLEDLETFWRAIFVMKPWKYDHSVLPIPWREIDLVHGKPIRWGVLWDDGVVAPSPACRRALETVVSELKSRGHEVVDIDPPNPYEGLKLGSQLLLAEGAKLSMRPIRWGESNDPGVRQARLMFAMPRFVKSLYAWYLRYIKKDEIYAGLIDGWYEKTTEQYLGLVAQREGYRERWFQKLRDEAFDFILTVPNALPATPHKGMKEGFRGCGYTFLWNILDYSAGVLPVTHVDKDLDALGKFAPRNTVERDMYKMYDANKMHGLPVGVQVVGKRLEEEKVLEGMKLIEGLLKDAGKWYSLLEPID